MSVKNEDLIEHLHDRRRFVLLALGGSVVHALDPISPAAAQAPEPTAVTPRAALAEEVRQFFIEAVGERPIDKKEDVDRQWQRATRLFRELVQFETEFFEVRYIYRYNDSFSSALRPVELDLGKFESEEQRIHKELPASAGDASGTARLLVSKILALIGAADISVPFFELLDKHNLIRPVESAVMARNWTAAARALGKLFDGILQKAFVYELVERAGKTAAARFVGNCSARFVPVLGWLIMIGSLLFTIREQLRE